MPKRNTSIVCIVLKKNRCAMRTALSPSASATTVLIERSDEPCAIAWMLMPPKASAEKKVPATPRRCFIPSPTIETIAIFGMTEMASMRFSRISSANSSSRTFLTECASRPLTQKLIVYSELDWVMRSTETPERLTALNTRAAVPRLPLSPAPATLTSVASLRHETPRTGPAAGSTAIESAAAMRVPRAERLKLLRLQVSMRRAAIGVIVFG